MANDSVLLRAALTLLFAPAFTDLMGGQTEAMFPGLAATLPHIRSGRVRPLAITGQMRHAQLKDIPTMLEPGFKDFDAQQWYGVVGPAAMPASVVRQLNETLATVLRAPDLREKLSSEAIEPLVMAPDQFGEFIKTDIAGNSPEREIMSARMASRPSAVHAGDITSSNT